MVRDRLAEMQAKAAEASSSSKKGEKTGSSVPLLSSENQLTDSLNRVSQFDEKIKTMRETIDEMDKLQKHILTQAVVDKVEAKRLEKLSDTIFANSTEIQKEINTFREEMQALHMDSHHERIVENHLKRLNAETTKASNEFRAAQVEYIEKTKKLHNRKVEIVTGGDEAKGSELNLDPNNIQAVFAGDFLLEAAKARQELRELETRDTEIKKIEGSVIEVNRLFKEINALIMEQGETIDSIEKHVNAAEVEVEKGVGQLDEARKSQTAARKKKLCCIGVLVAVLVIVAVLVAILLTSNNSD